MRKSEPRRKLPPIIRVRIFEQEHVVALLRAEIERSGGQSAWARKTGADRSLLSRILKGHWHPIKAIIEALGLRLAAVSDDRPVKKGRGKSNGSRLVSICRGRRDSCSHRSRSLAVRFVVRRMNAARRPRPYRASGSLAGQLWPTQIRREFAHANCQSRRVCAPVMPCPSGTVSPVGIQGDTMYKLLLEADAALALTLAFAAVLFVVGALARVLRQLTTEQNNRSNAHRSSAETI
jgi:hypothetical protein